MTIILYECMYCRASTRAGITIVKNTGKLVQFCSGTCLKMWNVRHMKKITDACHKKKIDRAKDKPIAE